MILQTLEDEMEFGKFQGMTWGEILIIHPGYLKWAAENLRDCYLYITDEALEEIREMFPSIEMNQDFYRNVENQRACYDACMEENKIEQINGFNDWNEESPTYERYNGAYAHDEMGYSDDDIDTIFDGDPLAYWNID